MILDRTVNNIDAKIRLLTRSLSWCGKAQNLNSRIFDRTNQKNMKKHLLNRILLTAVMAAFTLTLACAQDAGDIFTQSKTKIVWLGVDFTQVQLIGPLGTVGTVRGLVSLAQNVQEKRDRDAAA